MPDSAVFEARVARMLNAGGEAAPSDDIGWRVYRNTVIRGAIDALAAHFPSVVKLVGQAWFEACARLFVRQHPPTTPCLLDYGAAFPIFLADFEPAQSLPYLADVAQMDRWWSEAHVAADAPVWTRAQFDASDADVRADIAGALHPSLRFGAFTQRSPSVWLYNKAVSPGEPPVFDFSSEALLILRPAADVEYRRASLSEVQLLCLLKTGRGLLEAGRAVAGEDIAANNLIVGLIETGVFVSPSTGT